MITKFFGEIQSLFNTRQRREVLVALTAAYMVVQLQSLPIALALPTLAEYFSTGIDDVALLVVIYLLMLGSLVLLMARLGDRLGHAKVFFTGLVITTVGAIGLSVTQDLWQMVALRGVTGVGAAMVTGNANALLAVEFTPDERGRAFAIPIVGARFGTLTGLAVFGLLLHFGLWRLIFATFVPLGIVAILVSIPMLRHTDQPKTAGAQGPIDWSGATLLFLGAVAFILAGNHLHVGEESYTSPDALAYHIPMHALTLLLVGAFIIVERRVANPVVDIGHFKNWNFSLSLLSNVIFHGSMLGTLTLVPILVEEGFDKSPIFVTYVLVPMQSLGLFLPAIAGWVYDRYRPRYLRMWSLVLIAGGFMLLSMAAPNVSFWWLPLFMLPIAIGTNTFNPINNAHVINSLSLEHRGVASGMLETSREMGHALGGTAAAAVLGLVIPAGVEALPFIDSRGFFLEGFQLSAMTVVAALLVGALLVYFQQATRIKIETITGSDG